MIHELSESEFHGTFSLPMRRLEANESCRPVPLKDYVSKCIDRYVLRASLEDLRIEHVYVSGDQRYRHVMLSYGIANTYLVIIVAIEKDAILGHHFLDLNEKYGLVSPLQDAAEGN